LHVSPPEAFANVEVGEVEVDEDAAALESSNDADRHAERGCDLACAPRTHAKSYGGTHLAVHRIIRMPVHEVRASGLEYLALATELLQRARLTDPVAGLWEAADLQWWWRTPRRSDAIDQLFWVDDKGPVAGVVLTDWGRAWGCDPIVVPSASVPLALVWARAVEAIDGLVLDAVEVLARDDDVELLDLLAGSGFTAADERSGTMWMDAADRPEVSALPEEFVLVDRAEGTTRPHPMRRRSGEGVDARLRQCSLYDPALDLAVETAAGETAGYALFWFDPVTRVGLVEPMRVEDAYQRRGLARALLTAGLERLARRGARRLKVGYATDVARRLYVGAGFDVISTSRSYSRRRT
jgi:ribosomal protein S18 acetylase RimI-like enzyme